MHVHGGEVALEQAQTAEVQLEDVRADDDFDRPKVLEDVDDALVQITARRGMVMRTIRNSKGRVARTG